MVSCMSHCARPRSFSSFKISTCCSISRFLNSNVYILLHCLFHRHTASKSWSKFILGPCRDSKASVNSLKEDDDGKGAEEEQLENNVASENDDSAEESSCWVSMEGEAEGKWSYSNRHRSRFFL